MQSKKCKDRSCPLWRKIEVRYEGNLKADIAVVGESPGQTEERKGRPFIGRAGVLGKEVTAEAGLEWKEMFILNSARCRIEKKEMSTKEITATLKCCRRRVETALSHIRSGQGPQCIVLFGDYAMRQILRKSGIRKARGRWVWSDEFTCWVMPTFHPAYILRNPGEREFLLHDLKTVAAFKERGFKHEEKDEALDYREIVDFRQVIEEGAYVSVDTESQGLDWTSPNFVMLSASVSDARGRAYQVSFYEECPPARAKRVIQWPRVPEGGKRKEEAKVGIRKCKRFQSRVNGLRWLLENGKVKKVMQHGNFDLHCFDRFFQDLGVPWELNGYVMDIQAAANVLDENLYKLASLEDLQGFFTDYAEDYARKFDQTHDKGDMLAVPAEARLSYACADADVTRRAALEIRKRLIQSPKLARYYVRMVHPTLTGALRALEANGAWIDPEMLPQTTEEVENLWKEEVKGALKCTPRAVKKAHVKKGLKLTRDEFVRDVLFDEDGFGLPVDKTTAGGAPSIDKEVRRTMLDRRLSAKSRGFITHYNEWSELYTLWSRYLRGFGKHIRVNGRIHSSMSLATTVTGRVASRNPNMQNNPKRSKSATKIRQLIAAPPGWVLLAADEEQCLVPETELITIDGIKTLAQVIEKRIPVLAVTEDWDLSFQRVINVWSTGKKEILEITLEDGAIEKCSKNHRFRRWSGEWAYAEDLCPGDRLAHIAQTESMGYPAWRIGRMGSRGAASVRCHRVVGEFLARDTTWKKWEAHHLDGDKQNWFRKNIGVLPRGEHKRVHAVGKKNPNYGNRHGSYIMCPVCGKRKYLPPSRAAVEITCSKRCSNLAFPRRVHGNHKVAAICKNGVRETFQIEVENVHTYVLASGLVSKNSELRWAAHVSNSSSMIKVFRNGADIHTVTAQSMTKWDEMDALARKESRQRAKPVNFGMLYLMSAAGLSRYAKMEYGVSMTEQEAERYIRIWFRTYPELRDYHRKTIDFCKRYGYVESPLGRRRRLPEINSDDKWVRHEAERMAVNHPIQGPSSDVVLLCCNELLREEMLDPTEAFPVLFVHDELVFQVKDTSRIQDYAKAIKHAMENPPLKRDFGFRLRVPLASEIKAGPNLAKMETIM
jgi:uracil-DNA glycosylase family 4